MLYRALAILVVGFWLTMIGLLIRKETGPADSALREVPLSHIVKLLLLHEQRSDLNIYSDKLRLGHLAIQPRMPAGDQARVIQFSGSLQIILPGWERQRMTWDGEMELANDLALRRFTLALASNDPTQHHPAYRTEIAIDPAENSLTWTEVGENALTGQPHFYSLDDAGLQKALGEMFPDPAMLQMVRGQAKSLAPPVVRALQSSMLIHGERIDTYLVTIEQSGQTLLAFDIDQLGHILRAKTLIGYSLAPFDLVQ